MCFAVCGFFRIPIPFFWVVFFLFFFQDLFPTKFIMYRGLFFLPLVPPPPPPDMSSDGCAMMFLSLNYLRGDGCYILPPPAHIPLYRWPIRVRLLFFLFQQLALLGGAFGPPPPPPWHDFFLPSLRFFEVLCFMIPKLVSVSFTPS